MNLDKLAEILVREEVVKAREMIIDFATNNQLLKADFSPGKYLILPQTQLSDLVNGFVVDESGHGKSEQKVNVLFNRCRDIYQMAGNVSSLLPYVYNKKSFNDRNNHETIKGMLLTVPVTSRKA